MNKKTQFYVDDILSIELKVFSTLMISFLILELQIRNGRRKQCHIENYHKWRVDRQRRQTNVSVFAVFYVPSHIQIKCQLKILKGLFFISIFSERNEIYDNYIKIFNKIYKFM